MKKLQIIPLEKSGDVNLGELRSVVIQEIGRPSSSVGSVDYYQADTPMFSVHYDQSLKVAFIEVANPNDANIKVILYGLDVFNIPASSLIDQIISETGKSFNEEDTEVPYSFTFPEIELALWRPVIPENDNDDEGKYFESIGIGIKGYFSGEQGGV